MMWLDNLILQYADRQSLFCDNNGVRVPGMYHGLSQLSHSQVEGRLSELSQWSTQCEAANCSAGRCVSVEGAGKGNCTYVPRKFGPFMTY